MFNSSSLLYPLLLATSFIILGIKGSSDDNIFNVENQQLLLPEVPSRLNFDNLAEFAPDNDTRAQIELRDTRFWGRLYVEGWPQPIQYFLSHFSSAPSMDSQPMILADPVLGCEPLRNAKEIRNKSAVVVMERGVCSFGTKARMAVEAGADTVIYINNEPGLLHAPGPDAHDLNVCAVTITQQEGALLKNSIVKAARRQGEEGPYARLIPMHCGTASTFRTNNLCEPATMEERDFITHGLIAGGFLSVSSSSSVANEQDRFEYLLAHFGTWAPPLRGMGTISDEVEGDMESIPLIQAQPYDACTPLEEAVDGHAVLVERGGCSYLEKALNVERAGGQVLLVANNEPVVLRAGVDPRVAGLEVNITVATITNTAGKVLQTQLVEQKQKQSKQPGVVSIHMDPHHEVQAIVWDELASLLNKKAWPRHPRRARELFEMLTARESAWPERLHALRQAYALVDPDSLLEYGRKEEL